MGYTSLFAVKSVARSAKKFIATYNRSVWVYCIYCVLFLVQIHSLELGPDFVLVYKNKKENEGKRTVYEETLKNAGLRLEHIGIPIDNEHYQIYVYANNHILLQYAELLKLRMPIKGTKKQLNSHNKEYYTCFQNIQRCLKKICSGCKVNVNIFPKQKGTLTEEFSTNREYLFDVNSPTFFNESQRSMIVSYILELQSFENDVAEEIKDTGLQKLISDGVYSAAYPLHNNEFRDRLLNEWATLSKFYKYQPIDAIKEYFGVKIALYFAWLGFYTYMLIPVAIFGLGCFMYGWYTMSNDQPTNDVCNPNLNIIMCPLCDKDCDYWPLTEACLYAKMTYLFDNYVTLGFAIVMSVWSSIYLNLWKNYSSEMIHRWGLSDLRPENKYPRPEYLARIKKLQAKKKIKNKKKICKITEREEPRIPWIIKLPVMICSYTIVLFWIGLLFGVLLSILVFRVSEEISELLFSNQDDITFRNVVVPITSAVLDLIFILILNNVYSFIAVLLTKKEFWRTQGQFDDSLTLKIYVFQFINYYSSFFYIAFVKGRFIGRPGNYTRFIFNNRRLEECGPGGCLVELCIQLTVVMIGDQLWGQFMEYGFPYLQQKWIGRRLKKAQQKVEQIDSLENIPCTSSIQTKINTDHQLIEWNIRGLFEEYLEIVTQYGFVTLFVTAFPLAPLCALLNNIVEIRWDARKFLRDYRRPVAETARNIGIWLNIIDWIGKLAIISNGCIVAFTSNFVPRLVYLIGLEHHDEGFVEYSLAVFNTTDFENEYSSLLNKNVSICRYSDYRNPPWHENSYAKSKRFWHVLSARIVFVLVYQNVVILCKLFVKWLVPETSKKLKTQIMKEQWHLYKIIAKHQAEEKIKKSKL